MTETDDTAAVNALVNQLGRDMTFARFLKERQPKFIKYGHGVIIPYIDGDTVKNRVIGLFRVKFPDHPQIIMIGLDDVTGDWYYH